MRERLRKLKENKGGFTLVELIVVLVILAILAGMLIPSLTGYIDKAHEKTALLECRQAVLAAQVKASEEYGKGNTTVVFNLTEIKELSEVPGTVNTVTAVDGKVTYLKYTSKRGIVVIYENGEYRIEGKTEGGGESGDGTGGGEAGTPDVGPGAGENPGKGELDFTVGEVLFNAGNDADVLLEEARKSDSYKWITLAPGLYKVGDGYYCVKGDTPYGGGTSSMGGSSVKINTQGIKSYSELRGAAKPGDVYISNGKYYVAFEGAGNYQSEGIMTEFSNWVEIFPKEIN